MSFPDIFDRQGFVPAVCASVVDRSVPLDGGRGLILASFSGLGRKRVSYPAVVPGPRPPATRILAPCVKDASGITRGHGAGDFFRFR